MKKRLYFWTVIMNPAFVVTDIYKFKKLPSMSSFYAKKQVVRELEDRNGFFF